MAFVPGYDHDVFISYAHVDNEPLNYNGRDLRWVTSFKEQLQKLVDQQLGRINASRVWMDIKDLPGNELVTPTLEGAVRKTATLIVILSKGYLKSEWCQREMREFVELNKSQDRLFILHLADIPFEARPEEIRDLNGFRFYDPEEKDQLNPDSAAFRHELRKLKTSLAGKLEAMHQVPDSIVEVEETITPLPAVLLAEGAPDLEVERDALRTYVKSLGYRVLPLKPYRRGAQDFQEMLDQDLAESKLFIQLLGQYVTPQTDDLPGGYGGLQLERAKAAMIPALRSYGRDTVNFEKITSEFYRGFLQAEDVMALDLEQFKIEIKRRLDELVLLDRMQGAVGSKDSPVFINARSEDVETAFHIRNRLENQNLPYEIIQEDEPLEAMAKTSSPAGLVLVYGEKSPGKWIKQQMDAFRTMALSMRPVDLLCALYFDPPEKRKELLRSPPTFFRMIDSKSGESEFVKSINDLKVRGTTP